MFFSATVPLTALIVGARAALWILRTNRSINKRAFLKFRHFWMLQDFYLFGFCFVGGINSLVLTVCLSAHFTDWLLSFSSGTSAWLYLGGDMGRCKTYGGRKTYQRTRSPENFWTPPKELLVCSVVDFCTGKQSTDTWGGWKTYDTRGVQNPFLGGVSFVRFSSPLFFPPPHGVLWFTEWTPGMSFCFKSAYLGGVNSLQNFFNLPHVCWMVRSGKVPYA